MRREFITAIKCKCNKAFEIGNFPAFYSKKLFHYAPQKASEKLLRN